MTVDEYRAKNRSCRYCVHRCRDHSHCNALDDYITNSKMAKRCPLYYPRKYVDGDTVDLLEEIATLKMLLSTSNIEMVGDDE